MTGEQIVWLGLAAFGGLTVVLVGAALVSPRVERPTLLRGARNGLLVALGLGGIVALAVTLLFNGQPFLFGTLDLVGAFKLGLLLGAPLAVGYFWLGLVLVAAGLLRGARPSWATREAWVVTPGLAIVLTSAAGFGLAMAQRGAEPQIASRPGQADLVLQAGTIGRLTGSGPAHCQSSSTGGFGVYVGEFDAPRLELQAGHTAAIQLTVQADESVQLVLQLDELLAAPGRGSGPAPQTMQLAEGWTRTAGELRFQGLQPLDPESGEPLPGESWRGNLRWTCSD